MMSSSPGKGHSRDSIRSSDGDRRPCRTQSACNWSSCIDVRQLRTDVARRFAQAGIGRRYVDTAVVECLQAVNSGRRVSPLRYCLAIGRRLQEESAARASTRQTGFESRFSNTCSHGVIGEHCQECEMDRERAIELFPSLRRYLPASLVPRRSEGARG